MELYYSELPEEPDRQSKDTMKNTILRTLICLALFTTTISGLSAQFGIGATLTHDLYNRYSNPDDGVAHSANGSAILNLGIGPKMWFGGESFSISLESQAVIGFLGLSMPDYKGLGNLAFPIMAKMNFAGLSTLNKEGRFGLSIGGGIQYNRTELYYLAKKYKNQGVERSYFKTYVVQVGYGFGISGFGGQFFVRYGFNPDLDGANSLNIGLQYDFNGTRLKEIDDPNSRL